MQNKNVIRFEFTKKDGLKYISHLDLQRAMARIIKRSRIPIRYTEGFNPHPKMVFALNVSVGAESECELLDVYIIMDEKRPGVPLYTPEEFKRDIVPNLPKGLDFVSADYPEKPFVDIKSSVYEIKVDLTDSEDVTGIIEAILKSPLIVRKKSKAGDKDVDITPMIFNSSVTQKGTALTLMLELSAAQNEFLNPEYVMTGLKNSGMLENKIDFYTVTRKKINFR